MILDENACKLFLSLRKQQLSLYSSLIWEYSASRRTYLSRQNFLGTLFPRFQDLDSPKKKRGTVSKQTTSSATRLQKNDSDAKGKLKNEFVVFKASGDRGRPLDRCHRVLSTVPTSV